jgi:hypothetical protein
MSSSIPNLHDEAYIVYLSSRVRNDYSNRVSCCTLFLYSINFDSTQRFHCLTLLIKCVRKMILVLQGNWNSQRKMKHNKYFNMQPYTLKLILLECMGKYFGLLILSTFIFSYKIENSAPENEYFYHQVCTFCKQNFQPP